MGRFHDARALRSPSTIPALTRAEIVMPLDVLKPDPSNLALVLQMDPAAPNVSDAFAQAHARRSARVRAVVEHQGVQDGDGHISAARGRVTRRAFEVGAQVSLHMPVRVSLGMAGRLSGCVTPRVSVRLALRVSAPVAVPISRSDFPQMSIARTRFSAAVHPLSTTPWKVSTTVHPRAAALRKSSRTFSRGVWQRVRDFPPPAAACPMGSPRPGFLSARHPT